MPIRRGHDSHGYFYQWGGAKKYYYVANNPSSRTKAKNKAAKQGRAIELHKHRI